jgi:sugar (pentulose or hexulose) kinase
MTTIAVLDIGKTNVKLALVDPVRRQELGVVTRPNLVLPGPPYPHYDVEGHWAFFLGALRNAARHHRIDGIAVTTHGASVAVLDGQGGLAAPVLDYEHNGPQEVAADYDALRPPFALTGTGRMPNGLNVGAQLHWLLHRDPGLSDRVARVVSWPGYWVHRLTGVAGYDLTSIGCHTDLWVPARAEFSPLVARLGLAGKMASAVPPGQIAGPILPEVAAATGLSADTPVVFGIHDSNASLLPHLLARKAPFSVVSTGTWVVCMAVGGAQVSLDQGRDVLVNVNALGQPTPSAKFMGGREYEMLMAGHPTTATSEDEAAVLAEGVFLLPSVVAGSGPFPHHQARWVGAEPQGGPRQVAVSHYLAMVSATCLSMIGAAGEIIVEGPFARNRAFLAMLASATGRRVGAALSQTGTAIGAAMLFTDASAPMEEALEVTLPDPRAAELARKWADAVENRGSL